MAVPILFAGWNALFATVNFAGSLAWKPFHFIKIPLLFSFLYYAIGENFIKD